MKLLITLMLLLINVTTYAQQNLVDRHINRGTIVHIKEDTVFVNNEIFTNLSSSERNELYSALIDYTGYEVISFTIYESTPQRYEATQQRYERPILPKDRTTATLISLVLVGGGTFTRVKRELVFCYYLVAQRQY